MKPRCLLALIIASAWQVTVPSYSMGGEPTPTPAVTLTFLQQLQHLAGKKPSPVVAVAIGRGFAQRKPPVVCSGKPLKDALQDIGAAYSEPVREKAPKALAEEFEASREVYIPFEFDRVWTVGRDLQWVVNVDPPDPDYLAATEPGALVADLVRSLRAEQWRQAGAPGLAIEDLTLEQQKVFRAAFERPVVLRQMLPGEPGKNTPQMKTDFDGVVDVDHARLHVYTAWREVSVGTERTPDGEEVGIPYPLKPFDGSIRFPRSPAAAAGYTTPTLLSEPSHLKTGDLNFDAAPLLLPIGIHGESTVAKAISAAAKKAHLQLKVDPRLGGYAVYIGDPELRSGDVLRAITFDLQGAFRKVGKTYLLTFDRIGIAALNMVLAERLWEMDLHKAQMRDALLGADNSNWWRQAPRFLKPDPEGPPGPTLEQVAVLMKPRKPGTGYPAIPFGDLTPDQQAAVQTALRADSWLMRSPDMDDPKTRTTLEKATFDKVYLRVVLEVAGGGRYTVQDNVIFVQPAVEQFYEDQRNGKEPDPPVKAPDGPIILKAKTRAIAVPPLRASEWPRLFAQMRRKGIGTLYMPVLWDGHALFPSQQFPLLADAKGQDVLKSVLAQAKAANVKIVGVVHTLSWRFPAGAKTHWLTRHPELVSKDLLGRRRWDWTQERAEVGAGDPLSGWHPANDPLTLGDLVAPNDPRVRQRLVGLLEELKGYPGLSGVTFAEWSRLMSAPNSGYSSLANEPAPVLGYAETEREAFLVKEGIDPVDLTSAGYQRLELPYSRFSGANRPDLEVKWLSTVLAADANLTKALVVQAEKSWPGQVGLFLPFGPRDKIDDALYPKADVHPRFRPEPEEVLPTDYVWVAPACSLWNKATPEARLAEWRSQFAWAEAVRRARKAPEQNGIVLDFRNAPDLLWNGLDRLAVKEAPRRR